jgi:hypothetical protein
MQVFTLNPNIYTLFPRWRPAETPLLSGFEQPPKARKILVKFFARDIVFFRLVCYYTNDRRNTEENSTCPENEWPPFPLEPRHPAGVHDFLGGYISLRIGEKYFVKIGTCP